MVRQILELKSNADTKPTPGMPVMLTARASLLVVAGTIRVPLVANKETSALVDTTLHITENLQTPVAQQAAPFIHAALGTLSGDAANMMHAKQHRRPHVRVET